MFPSVFSTHQAPFWVLKPFIMKGSEFPTVWLGDPRFCCHPCAEKAAQPGDLGARGGERGGRPVRGLGARGAVPPASRLLGSQPAEPASSRTPGQMFPGLVGWQGHTADTKPLLPPCQESDTTLANRLFLQPPGRSLPWGLCSVALKGDPAQQQRQLLC